MPFSAVLALGAGLAAAEATRPLDHDPGDYRVAQWTTLQGLPQNTVTDMVFLPSGELWLATFGGLARFDGHGFQVLDMAGDEGLPANRIVSLAGSGERSFLFLTQQGHLGRVEDGRSRLVAPPPGGSVEALELLVDRQGRAFCRAGDGKVWHTGDAGAWEPFGGGPSVSGLLHEFALDENGEVWGIWGDRLGRITGRSPEAWRALPERGAMVSPRRGGGLWLGLSRGVASFVDGRLDRLRVRPALAGEVTAIESAGAGALWVAAGGEVSRLERRSGGWWQRTVLPLRLPAAVPVRVLRLDAEGSLWIGTAGSGLYRVDRQPTRRFGAPSGLADIAALASDGAGGAFVASGCRHLLHLDRAGAARPVRLPGASPGEPLPPCGISLARSATGTTWVRSGRRLLRLQGLEARTVSRAVPSDEGPIVPTPDGSLWVVSRGGRVGLVAADGSLTRELQLPAPLMSASLAPDGALWIGGDGEVLRIGPRGADRIGSDANVPRGLVRDILAEPSGTVWIGTYGGGVGRLRGGRVSRLTVAQGLPDNSISRILNDGRGRLWISTNRGVAVIDEGAAEAVAEGRERAIAPVVLGAERGVPEANFGSPAGFADASGTLWFGTIDGAVTIDAAAFPFNTRPPVVRIEDVRADGQALALEPVVRVPPRRARLRVGYTAQSLRYPDEMRFRYRVEGRDEGWVDAGAERSVDWSPPGPGRHRFLVEARNEDGVWSSEPAVVVLDVRPAWWQTTAFHVAVVLALALLGLAGVRRHVRGIEREHAARLQALERQREAEQRLLAMRAEVEHVARAALAGELSTSLAHEVRQPVAAIVNNAEAGRRNLPHYLERPAELRQIFDDIVAGGMRVSQAVRDVRGVLGSHEVEPGAVDLSELVREVLPLLDRELEQNRIEVELALARTLPPIEGLRVQLGQVVVNLVSNACEALAGVEGERRITVSTAERDGRAELAVQDNGPGLEAAVAARLFEPFVTTKPEGLGMGLAICRSIAERHGGRLTASSPPGGGVRMTLTLPAAVPEAVRS